MNRNKKLAVAGVAALALVGGTFAAWTASNQIENPFNTKTFGGETVEEFNPLKGVDWKPGAEVDKKVSVKNTGTYPIYVRVKFEEKWSGLHADMDEKTLTSLQTTAGTSQSNATDGEVGADGSVVEKFMNDAGWTRETTGANEEWYVYNGTLAPGASTNNLLEKVKLMDTVDMGKEEEVITVTVTPRGTDATEHESEIIKENENTELIGKIVYDNVNEIKVVDGENDAKWVQISFKPSTDENGELTTPEAKLFKDQSTVISQSKKKQIVDEKGGYSNADYKLIITTQMSQDGTTWPAATAQ